jgi:hypothetical protein
MRRSRLVSVLTTSASLVVISTLAGMNVSAASHGTEGKDGVPAFGHVFVIIGENTALGQPRSSGHRSSSIRCNQRRRG